MAETKQEDIAKARAANAQAVQDSRESVWFLKEIHFGEKPRKIITQNYNGPCSFIAICNILILRGDVEILPPERTSVSYEFLSQLVGEYLLHASPDVDVSAALSIMPLTQKGMDLNPLFTSPTAFRPAGDGGALKLFEQAGIKLVHGWLVDPDSSEYKALSVTEDYDNSVNLIVHADTLSKGQFVVDDNAPGPSTAGPSTSHVSDNWSEEDKRKVEDALIVRHFLDTTSSQLTYHGLFTLASTLEAGSLAALFRGSHLSVLYKPESEDAALYTLVTDHIFYNEPSVVWERLEDVDGGSSTFVDSDFRRSSPVGGDFAGANLAAFEAGMYAEVDPADHELARQLQAEEDARAHELYAQHERQRAERRRQQQFQNPRGGPRQQPHPEWYAQRQYVQQQQQRYGPQGQSHDPNDPRFQPPNGAMLGSQGQFSPPPGPPPPGSVLQPQNYGDQDPGPRPGQQPGRVGNGPVKMKRKQSCLIM